MSQSIKHAPLPACPLSFLFSFPSSLLLLYFIFLPFLLSFLPPSLLLPSLTPSLLPFSLPPFLSFFFPRSSAYFLSPILMPWFYTGKAPFCVGLVCVHECVCCAFFLSLCYSLGFIEKIQLCLGVETLPTDRKQSLEELAQWQVQGQELLWSPEFLFRPDSGSSQRYSWLWKLPQKTTLRSIKTWSIGNWKTSDI